MKYFKKPLKQKTVAQTVTSYPPSAPANKYQILAHWQTIIVYLWAILHKLCYSEEAKKGRGKWCQTENTICLGNWGEENESTVKDKQRAKNKLQAALIIGHYRIHFIDYKRSQETPDKKLGQSFFLQYLLFGQNMGGGWIAPVAMQMEEQREKPRKQESRAFRLKTFLPPSLSEV